MRRGGAARRNRGRHRGPRVGRRPAHQLLPWAGARAPPPDPRGPPRGAARRRREAQPGRCAGPETRGRERGRRGTAQRRPAGQPAAAMGRRQGSAAAPRVGRRAGGGAAPAGAPAPEGRSWAAAGGAGRRRRRRRFGPRRRPAGAGPARRRGRRGGAPRRGRRPARRSTDWLWGVRPAFASNLSSAVCVQCQGALLDDRENQSRGKARPLQFTPPAQRRFLNYGCSVMLQFFICA